MSIISDAPYFFLCLKEMLEGTDLMSAYSTLSNQPSYDMYEKDQDYQPMHEPASSKSQQSAPKDDTMNLINKQFESDQKIATLMAELKRRKAASQTAQPYASSSSVAETESPSYFDKLFGKKKEMYKILQLSLMITLGLSVHFLIDHYLQKYLAEHDMSFERQLILRLMYPVAVLFIVWNLRVFVK